MLAVPGDITSIVATAIREDVGNADLSASLIAKQAFARARVICKENAILSGRPWFNEVFMQMDPRVTIHWQFDDGDALNNDDCICLLEGPTHILLTGERTALNFIQLLSGTATVSHYYCQLLADYPCTILDTRKTIPGLRSAQKYAVTCGGANNHRMGLYDEILIKENHIIAAGTITRAIETALRNHPDAEIEVEVETMQELTEAVEAGCNRVLLDNFTIEMMHEAVTTYQEQISLEVSGGVCEKNIIEIAETGVNFISIGALTKNVRAIDYSMRFDT